MYYNWHFNIAYDEFLEITLNARSGIDIKFFESDYDYHSGIMKGRAEVSYDYIERNSLNIINLYEDIYAYKVLVKWALKDYGKLRYLYETLTSKSWAHKTGAVFDEAPAEVAKFVVALANDSNWEEFMKDCKPGLVHPTVERYLNELDWYAVV
jgi:hypothetical protein